MIGGEKIGETLGGRYLLRKQIASGGTARIVAAEDTKLGRPVAVKLVLPSVPKELIHRLEREGRLAGAVAHPNVCALLDIGTSERGTPYLVFELLEGETLAERIARRDVFSIDEVLNIAEQLLAALGATHANGIVHRDVKPANVFLARFPAGAPLVKLLDFGTAQRPGDPVLDGVQITSTGLVVGTAEYMAPEQVRGLRDFDERTDIYACGVVLFELLAGRRPFAGLALPELLQAVAFTRAPSLADLNPSVPRPVAHAVDVALSTQRERRHSSTEMFVRALRASQAPALTGHTHVLDEGSAPRPAGADPSDWDLDTLESGPPEAALAHEPENGDASEPIIRRKR